MKHSLKSILTFALLTGGLSFPASAAPKLGMGPGVTGGSSGQKMIEYESWLNRRVDYLIQFIHFARFTGSDPSLTGTNWSFNGVNGLAPDMKERAVIAVGMLPYTDEGSTTLAKGANGDYDAHWRTFADRLINGGMGNNIIRLGWEHNGSWYRWNSIGKTASFKTYWIRIVNAMRYLEDGVTPRPGANFKFCWNPVPKDPNGHGNPLASYPGVGNQYVDIIGLDIYDTSGTYYKNKRSTFPTSYNDHFVSLAQTGVGTLAAWQVDNCRQGAWSETYEWGSYHLKWWTQQLNSATSVIYNMPVCIPEWGLDTITSGTEAGSGGRDNNYFIQKMYDWASIPANKVEWMAYFEAGAGTATRNHSICFATQYPLAKAFFPTRFAPLLKDEFEDGNFTDWTAWPTARWALIADGGDAALKFDFDWNNLTGKAEIGDTAWTNASLKVDFKVTDMQSWSDTRFYVRYVDSSNYYMAQVQEQGGTRRLILSKRVAGVNTTLGSVNVAVNANTWYELDLNVYKEFLTVKLNGVTRLSVSDTALTAGKIALGGYKQDVMFDNVELLP